MQQGVKQKQTSKRDELNSVILKILVLSMVSLVVNCSFSGTIGKSKPHSLKAGDYFGGASAAFWSPNNYVPREIMKKSARISQSPGGLE